MSARAHLSGFDHSLLDQGSWWRSFQHRSSHRQRRYNWNLRRHVLNWGCPEMKYTPKWQFYIILHHFTRFYWWEIMDLGVIYGKSPIFPQPQLWCRISPCGTSHRPGKQLSTAPWTSLPAQLQQGTNWERHTVGICPISNGTYGYSYWMLLLGSWYWIF